MTFSDLHHFTDTTFHTHLHRWITAATPWTSFLGATSLCTMRRTVAVAMYMRNHAPYPLRYWKDCPQNASGGRHVGPVKHHRHAKSSSNDINVWQKKHRYLLTCPSKYSVHPIRLNGSVHAGPFFVSPSLKNQQATWKSNGSIRSSFRLTRCDVIGIRQLNRGLPPARRDGDGIGRWCETGHAQSHCTIRRIVISI